MTGEKILFCVVPKGKSGPWYPVIFADGKTFDDVGMQAAIDNECVQFDNRVYFPGEGITIQNRTLLFESTLDWERTRGRHIHIERCLFVGNPFL